MITKDELTVATILVSIGVLTGLAKMFAAGEKPSIRTMLGRAVLSGFTGLAAAVVVLMIPGAPVLAQIGLACVLSQIGVSALERLIPNVGNWGAPNHKEIPNEPSE